MSPIFNSFVRIDMMALLGISPVAIPLTTATVDCDPALPPDPTNMVKNSVIIMCCSNNFSNDARIKLLKLCRINKPINHPTLCKYKSMALEFLYVNSASLLLL
ncbi:hypothetical protein D3C80_1810640 [compost metagenome]